MNPAWQDELPEQSGINPVPYTENKELIFLIHPSRPVKKVLIQCQF
jgi:hypothetical protein